MIVTFQSFELNSWFSVPQVMPCENYLILSPNARTDKLAILSVLHHLFITNSDTHHTTTISYCWLKINKIWINCRVPAAVFYQFPFICGHFIFNTIYFLTAFGRQALNQSFNSKGAMGTCLCLPSPKGHSQTYQWGNRNGALLLCQCCFYLHLQKHPVLFLTYGSLWTIL